MSKGLVERARNAHTTLGHSLHFGLCSELADRIEELEQQLALAKQVAIQSQEDAKNQYQKRVALEKLIEGKNGYKERIQQLYEENLRLGNEQIDLADKTREECIQACECEKLEENECEADRAYNIAIKHCTAAIRAMKERP